MTFTSVEEIGGEAVLGFVMTWIAGWFFFFGDLATSCVLIEPTTPSAGGSVEGLEGSEVGWGACGIKS